MTTTTVEQRRKEEADAVALGRFMVNEYVLRTAREGRAAELPAWARERLARLTNAARPGLVRALGGAT